MLIYIFFYLVFSVSGLVLIKKGGSGTNLDFIGSKLNINISLYIILGLVFYIISFFLWTIILKKEELSFIFPIITGISYVLIMICSMIFFDENISGYKLIGAIAIIVGIIFINIKR